MPNLFDASIRTAVYVTRPYGGVGGGSREASPYPDYPLFYTLSTQKVLAQDLRNGHLVLQLCYID